MAVTLPQFTARSAAMMAQKLEPARTDLFDKFTPLAKFMAGLGQKKRVSNGQLILFVETTDPGQLFQINTGRERVRHGERDGGKQIIEVLNALAYTYDFFEEETKVFADADGFKELVKNRTKNGDKAIAYELAKQFAMGSSVYVPGFTTLNGDATYNPRGSGAQTGVLRFEAPSAQTATTHNLARSTGYNWYNQFREVSSMAANGRQQIAGLKRDCNRETDSGASGGQILITDDASFENVVNSYADQVVYIEIPDGITDYMPSTNGVKIAGLQMWSDRSMSLTGFTTPSAQEGVGYLLTPSSWIRLQPAAGAEEESDIVDMTEQFGSTVRLRRWFNLMCEDLRKQGAITGINRA